MILLWPLSLVESRVTVTRLWRAVNYFRGFAVYLFDLIPDTESLVDSLIRCGYRCPFLSGIRLAECFRLKKSAVRIRFA